MLSFIVFKKFTFFCFWTWFNLNTELKFFAQYSYYPLYTFFCYVFAFSFNKTTSTLP